MPKNTSNGHYACAAVGLVASLLNAYNVYQGPGASPALDAKYYGYFGIFMAAAFGLGFVIAPEFLSKMKTKSPAWDGTHTFLGRFIGINMCVFGITLYALLDTAGSFAATGLWVSLAAIFGPTYAILYMDPVMTPDGVAGDPFLLLIGGIIGFLGTM
jgi:hypothetical protein